MINKFRFIFTVVFAMLAAGMLSPAEAQNSKPIVPASNSLVRSLPASDAVIAFNAQKFLDTALPQLLGADSPKLAEINAHISDIKAKTGLDLRQFEQATVGVKYRQVSPTEIDFEPVILAGGKFNAGAMVALLKIAAKGKYREEQASGKTFYVLQMNELLAQAAPNSQKSSSIEKLMGKVLQTFRGELAVGALNEKTLAMGTVARVREAFTESAPLSVELQTLGSAKPGTMLSFAGNVPVGVSEMFDLGNDEISKILNSLKTVSGHLDMNGANASLMIAGKTGTVEQAMNLEDTMNGLRALGEAFVSMMKASANEKDLYNRLIQNAKISRSAKQVQIDLLLTQNDLSILAKKL